MRSSTSSIITMAEPSFYVARTSRTTPFITDIPEYITPTSETERAEVKSTGVGLSGTAGCQMTERFVSAVNINIGDLIGWVETNGIVGYQDDDDDAFHIGDSADIGVVIHFLDNCNNCTCTTNHTLTCTQIPCAQDCSWGPWSGWSECSKSCGTGMTFRVRNIHLPALNGGKQCDETDDTQSVMCHVEDCPPSCQWSAWNEWSPCSQSCGGGIKQRTRRCDNTAQPDCECGDDSDQETETCNSNRCPDGSCDGNKVWIEDCTKYPSCPATCCDLGIDTCVPPDTCESACRCPIDTFENTNGTCVPKELCECCTENNVLPPGYTSSSGCKDWSVKQLASNGGKDCIGNHTNVRKCNTHECQPCVDDKGYIHKQLVTFNETECSFCICNPSLTISCLDKANSKGWPILSVVRLVDGGWSNWSEWGKCSRSCGLGTKMRTRNCSQPETKCGGTTCRGNGVETDQCNMGQCEYEIRNEACQLQNYTEVIALTDERGHLCQNTNQPSNKPSCEEFIMNYSAYSKNDSSIEIKFSGSQPKSGFGYERSLSNTDQGFVPDMNDRISSLQIAITPKDDRVVFVKELDFEVDGASELWLELYKGTKKAQVEVSCVESSFRKPSLERHRILQSVIIH
ncbi:hypothetical protein LSH36_143g05062 [Paralvinella palmiformis]|uniref:Spondin-like TSP1 domain-containing protein n=1 Tax=Paralvinella palmiformis TaxID=53620 RepID=A0AAD9JVF2_9ANNE|nr:hypothetical protein LSH36_143g05062 [Paralvinella palmiformis]